VLKRVAGACVDVGTGTTGGSLPAGGSLPTGGWPAGSGPGVDRPRPIGRWAFLGVAVASFGGPLALAALSAPGLVADAGDSAGLAMVAATALFAVPLAIWLRYARHVNTAGGLSAFVQAAAGRRTALAQAAIWTVSYVLYLVYTTIQISTTCCRRWRLARSTTRPCWHC
jgi:hypothetical protein